MSSPQAIRIAGDPVLRQRADEVTDIDSALVKLSEQMFITMYDAPDRKSTRLNSSHTATSRMPSSA